MLMKEVIRLKKRAKTMMNISLPMTILLVLLILKLMNQIEITWLWVFAPVWIPAAILGLFLITSGVVIVILEILKNE